MRTDTFVACAEERALADQHRAALMADRADGHAAREVYELLLEDYPAKSIEWVLAGHWRGPVEVDLASIDFSTRASWRASHEDITPYVERIKAGRVKPVVLVKRPGNPRLEVIDGHHRTLACETLKRPVLAYIAKVNEDEGPWTDLHEAQKKGSSRAHTSWLNESSRIPANKFSERDMRKGDAALAIVVNVQGEVLTVSRPEPPHELSIPGGMVDPGETPDVAALRELQEETGVVPDDANAPKLTKVGEFASPTDGRRVHVYRVSGWSGYAQALEADTRIGWLSPSDLLAQATLYGTTVKALLDLDAFDVAHGFADLSPADVHIGSGAHYRPGPPTEPKQMSVLNAKARKRIPRDRFALPKERKYPINDASHLHNAASRLEGEKNKGAIGGAKYREAKRNIARRARQLGVESKYAPKKKTGAGAHVRIHGELGKGGHIHVRSMMSELGPRAIGEIVSFSAEQVAKWADTGKVWVELGVPGRFMGHPAGDINLTREVFAQIVKNFHDDKARNPNRNIPIDFNHASEADPTSGTIPSEGTPAQGWIHDLRCDDQGHLWGLVQWGDLAKQYIREGKYAGISPAIRFGSKDKRTGEPIGARLTSAGLTNQPFLDLARLVASENQTAKPTTGPNAMAPEQLSLMGGYAHGAHEYMPKIRAAFGLHDLASADECSEHLSNLRDKFAACGGNPNGVHQGTQLAKYCFALRDLVNAPPGATWDEDVFDVVQELIDAAIREHELEYHAAGTSDGDVSYNTESDLDSDPGESTMADANLTTLLSEATSKLGAVEQKLTLSDQKLAATEQKLTLSEQALTAEKTARAEADKQVTALTAKFSAVDAELATLRTKLADQAKAIEAREAQDIERDVSECIATYADTKGTKEEMRVSLTEFRKTLPAQFAVMYPKVAPSQQHLQRTVVAGGNVREVTVPKHGEDAPMTLSKRALAQAISRQDRSDLASAQSAVLNMSEAQLRAAAKKYLGIESAA